jgi:hypothetical protein
LEDSLASGRFSTNISEYLKIQKKRLFIDSINKEYTIDKIWSIGGESGWYYGDWLWGIRGFIDKLLEA